MDIQKTPRIIYRNGRKVCMCNSNHRYKRIQSISYTLSKAINHICFIYAAEMVIHFNFIQVMAIRQIPILRNVQKSS